MSAGQIEGLLGLANVRDYGARADGQTNDTPRIHDAILALPAAGGTVVFPAGAYWLGTNVTFQGRTNVTFWLLAGATFVGPGALPANAGTNRVFDMSFVGGSFPPSGPAGGALAGIYPNPGLAAGGVPVTQAFGDAASAGASGLAADAGHRHGMPGVGSVSKVVLDQSLTTDVWSATNLAAGDNPITGLTNLSFTVDEGTDYLQVIVRSTAFVIPPTGSSFGWDVFIDGVLSKRLGRLFVAAGANGAIPGGTAYINGLAAGAHTMSIELWANAAQTGAAYLRAASVPTQEFAQVTAVEVRV